MKIAVVDDDKSLHRTMKQYVLKFQIAFDHDISVDYFTNCEELYQRLLAGDDYDLLFLDIEFPRMRGTELGLLIRHRLRDYDTQIVFMSAEKEYAAELFPIRPIGFLVKPFSFERFSVCLTDALDDFMQKSDFLEYTLENTRRRIRIKEVLYLKAHGKKVAFYTKEGSFSVYGKIQELIAGCTERFLCTSRGEYANLQHVMAAAPKEVRLTDNHVLHISRGRQTAVRERLAEL